MTNGFQVGAVLCGFLAWSAWASAQEVPLELSAPHLPIGKVMRTSLSPDGAYLIYQAYFDQRDYLSVYALPVAGGAGDEILLGEQRGNFGLPVGSLGFTDDSSRVFLGTQDRRLISVPITGGAETVLYDAGPDGVVTGAKATADDLVVFRVLPPDDGQPNIFVVPITGGTPLQLSQLPAPGWSALSSTVSPDGTRVVYSAAISLATELHSVPITGGAPVKISHQLEPAQRIDNFQFSPDGTTVVYEVGTPINANLYTNDLYSVPAAGGTPVLLHDGWDTPTGQSSGVFGVWTFLFTADSSQILFPDASSTQTELYTIPIGGGTKTLVDTQPLISRFSWFPEASRLFYKWLVPDYSVGTLELGAGPGVQLSVHPQGNIGTRFRISPDLSHVAYNARVLSGQRTDAYGVPTTGGDPVLLNDTQASQEDVYDLFATNERVIFERDRRLVSVPIEGGSETFLTETFQGPPIENRISLFPNGTDVAYRAGFDDPDLVELFKVSADGGPSERLHPPVPEVQGKVFDHVVGPTGQFVAYLSDQDDRGLFQLYEARTDGGGSGVPRLMSPPLASFEDVERGLILAAASATVLYRVDRGDGELWATPFGGEPRRVLELDDVEQYHLIEPGNKLVYLEGGELLELDLASGLIRSLATSPTGFSRFTLSADQSLVILKSGFGLWSLPIAGGTPTSLGVNGIVVEISPNNDWILVNDFSADIVLVAADGAEERDLGNIFGAFTKDGRYIFYELNAADELWSYSIAEDLHRRLDIGAGPEEYAIVDRVALDGNEILFSLTDSNFFVRRLFKVAADGGAPVSILDAAVDDRQIVDFFLSPDHGYLIVDVADELFGPSELYLTPMAGGPSRPLAGAGDARFVAFAPDHQLVLYQEEGTNFSAPLLAAAMPGGAEIGLIPEGIGEVDGDPIFGPGDLMTFRIAQHKERTGVFSLDLGDFVLFSDNFEGGDLSSWSFSQQ